MGEITKMWSNILLFFAILDNKKVEFSFTNKVKNQFFFRMSATFRQLNLQKVVGLDFSKQAFVSVIIGIMTAF